MVVTKHDTNPELFNTKFRLNFHNTNNNASLGIYIYNIYVYFNIYIHIYIIKLP